LGVEAEGSSISIGRAHFLERSLRSYDIRGAMPRGDQSIRTPFVNLRRVQKSTGENELVAEDFHRPISPV